MNKTRIALVLVGVLALVGGGTALANKGKGTHRVAALNVRAPHGPSDDLQAAASYLGTTADGLLTQLQAGKTLAQIASATNGKSTAGLIAALVAAEKTEITTAVTAGKLTQAQADAIIANLTERFTDFVNGAHPRDGFGPGGAHGPGQLNPVSTYLGIGVDSILSQLMAGKTLAQIASATSGKSAPGLIAALVADAKTRLGANVPTDLEQRITDLVNGVKPGWGPPGGDHGRPFLHFSSRA